MKQITLNTAKQIMPMIYAYTTPEIARHNGWTKIGYTEQEVEKRLKQQTHTADVVYNLEWRGNAIFDDGSGERFSDKDFHRYLRKLDIENKPDTEWFHIDGKGSKAMFNDFRSNRGILKALDTLAPYTLRSEQADAVAKTAEYAGTHEKGEYLWNAKPRFGKTLSVYDLVKTIDARNVLIVTNRPAIANSWYDDYVHFLGAESGYLFVSEVEALKGKKYVLTRAQYLEALDSLDDDIKGCIEFVSLQDLKGSKYFGGEYEKLKELQEINWSILVIDEAHEGVDTYKTNIAFNHIKRDFTLHLSGTPFKALANDKFREDAIYNWTYADEQRAKRDWNSPEGNENPYATLPKLNLFTYQMSEIIRDELEQGIEINGETEEYAFDLNEFFAVKNGKFVHESSVDKFLDALTTQVKFPFSTEELRAELKHTFWLLNYVDSAKALAKKLKEHPVFSEYEIVLAAGDGKTELAAVCPKARHDVAQQWQTRGKLSDDDENEKSYDKVVKAIREHEKTITLSVGQLTTGITIPEWSAVLMLSSVKSPALYMQAAFRAQNPCLFKSGHEFYRKENAYVFDFDPARTLTIFEEFANDLSSATSDGRGDADTRKENVRELLNFFPVIGEDEQGEMIELDAEKVLSIPRRIRSQEVIRRGFMSDFLFQNISNIFRAPQEVIDIISSFEPVKEPDAKVPVTDSTAQELSLNEDGEVELKEEIVIGISNDLFGEKIFGSAREEFDRIISEIEPAQETSSVVERLAEKFRTEAVKPILEAAREKYTGDLKPSEQKRIERKLTDEAERRVNVTYGDYQIQQNVIESERQKALEAAQYDAARTAAVNEEYDSKLREATETLKEQLSAVADSFVHTAGEEVVRTVETQKKEQEKKSIEDSVRDHLRGFSRTIPSFLMAYGDEDVTLDTFDRIIPDKVFIEVTSISLEQFRFLRDGGDYTDENGVAQHFEGRLFDPVVFNDSVKEFLRKKVELADYFDETAVEDIFDYIPPQKTNQIFTPKWVVRKMADMLEQENPHCFDDPDKTFIDMYMKSGLYIAEIVKRLYQSDKMKELYPDGAARLRHIFEKQVYGLAPTEIIYRIATNFILGFNNENLIEKSNFKLLDALKYAKDETLQEEIDKAFAK